MALHAELLSAMRCIMEQQQTGPRNGATAPAHGPRAVCGSTGQQCSRAGLRPVCAALLLHGRLALPRQQGHQSLTCLELPHEPKATREPTLLALQLFYVQVLLWTAYLSCLCAQVACRSVCWAAKHDGRFHLPLCCTQLCLSHGSARVMYAPPLGLACKSAMPKVCGVCFTRSLWCRR